MIIIVKKKGLLEIKNLSLKCALGKGGIKKNKKESDKATPKGIFDLGFLYYRDDRIKNLRNLGSNQKFMHKTSRDRAAKESKILGIFQNTLFFTGITMTSISV